MLGFDFEKFNKGCYDCGAKDHLTLHHLKDTKGFKTGKTRILCRPCHNAAEHLYGLAGKTSYTLKSYIDPNLKLELDYMNGKIPFYSSK